MTQLRSLLVILAITICSTVAASATTLHDESLNYKVIYKWGLIHKQAGRGTLILRSSPRQYKATLYARSEPWADRIYKLRDTLSSTMEKTTLAPMLYERIAHEDGKYSHDIVKFTRTDMNFTGHCTRYRRGKNDKNTSEANITLQAQGMTVDLLSAFYYLRSFDFNSMSAGASRTINIFSGRRKELLKITFNGIDELKLDGKKQNAFKVTFTFTSEGKKNTSDPIEAWLSTDARHIPLKLIGKLKIGQIQCIYVP